MSSRCSAVVLSYSRTGNLPRIVDSLLAQPFVDDVTIWHQGHEALRLSDGYQERLFGYWRPNEYRLGRFSAMEHCRHDTVLTVDDDVLPRNLDRLWGTWCDDPTRIAASLARGHLRTDAGRRWKTAHEVLIGFGAIVDRRWRSVFRLYTAKFGTDDVLLRKADRIFSILQNRHHNVIRADYVELPGASDATAEWRQPDHQGMFREARRRCVNGILGLNVSEHKFRRT